MRPFERAVAATLRRLAMVKGGERILVAVSGGADSLALVHALAALADTFDVQLHVAHFDHRLRARSGDDASFVASAARRLRLPFTLGSADPGPRPAGISPEEAAREQRLRFLHEVADSAAVDRIATGHTLDDQAETVLMRLLLGAGARGLGGIAPSSGRMIRPLIERRRDETLSYCRELGLEPRVDETNENPAYLRNAIRLEVLPFLARRVNARVAEALARSAASFRDDDALLDEIALETIAFEQRGRAVGLDAEALLALHPALQRRAVRLALGDPPPSFSAVESVLGLVARGRSGDAIDLGRGLNARLEYGSLLLGRAPSPAPPSRTVTLTVPGRTDLPSWGAVVEVWVVERVPATWPDGKGAAVFDADAIGSRVVVRARRRGDRMTPLGAPGSRAVADVLSEAKVARAQRDRVPVVEAGGTIAWLVGHRTSEAFKVTPETQRFLWMTFEGGPPWRS